MLVLTRKHQEKIRIGDNITITILKTKGKAVRVGIEAPPEIAVIRDELGTPGRTGTAAAEMAEGREALAAEQSRSRRPRTRVPQSTWSTSSTEPSNASRRRQPNIQVSLQRVSREDTTRLLPHLTTEGGPLRSMIQRRAAV
jgi:carbon storage regulator CsrA